MTVRCPAAITLGHMAKRTPGHRHGRGGDGRPSGRSVQRPGRSVEWKPAAPSSEPATALGPFRLGVIPGATAGKWVDRWREQRPDSPIELVPLSVAGQRAAIGAGEVDAAIVRLPLEGEPGDVHVIRLYDEDPVVVASNESSLMAGDELHPDDLADEVLVTPADDIYGDLGLPTEPAGFDPPATTEEAIEIVASGAGIVVVPMSLARLHHRRDVEYRTLVGAPVSTVALVWLRERDAEDVQHLAGITRGRGAHSSR